LGGVHEQTQLSRWTLGANLCGAPLTGHVQSTRPFNNAIAVSMPGGRPLVMSGDDCGYRGTPGARLWVPGSDGPWCSSEVDYDVGGYVRCVQAITPPQSISVSPFVGLLSASRLVVLKTTPN
jgi:hypothetical protein